MVMGRPREYDLAIIGDRLIEWAKRDDSINFNKFCCTHDPIIPPTYLLRWSKEDNDFCMAYEKAKAFLGARREEWLSSDLLHVKTYDLNATVYDIFLRDEQRQQKEFESSLKQKEEQNIPPLQNQISLADTIIKQQARIAELEAKLADQQ